MSDVLALATNPWAALVGLLLTALAFGFAPGLVNRLIVRIYPRDAPRRAELIAELYTVPWVERWNRVAQTLELALSEGVPARFRAIRANRNAAHAMRDVGLPREEGFFMDITDLRGIRAHLMVDLSEQFTEITLRTTHGTFHQVEEGSGATLRTREIEIRAHVKRQTLTVDISSRTSDATHVYKFPIEFSPRRRPRTASR